MRRKWEKILATFCTALMLATMPCMGVLAEDLEEEEIIISEAVNPEQFDDNSELFSEETELREEEIIISEATDSEQTDDYTKLPIDDSIRVEDVSATSEINTEVVGSGTYSVNSKVTATFDEDTGAVELYSNDGELSWDWISKLGIPKEEIRSIKVVSGTVYLDSSAGYMFSDCSNLTNIDFSGFDTSKVRSLTGMFKRCKSLTSLDLSNFDTSNVIGMNEMFEVCTSLTELDLSSFDTTNVTRMGNMFRFCTSLTKLNLSSFDTSKVTIMRSMFSDCRSLTSLELSNFDTSNVTDMGDMFYGCYRLRSLDLSNFDTSNVTDMSSMFSGINLTDLDLRNFDTSNVTNMGHMFSSSELRELDLSNFDTSAVTNMEYMFYNCSGLAFLNLSSFDMLNVKNANEMLTDCVGLLRLESPKRTSVKIDLPISMYYKGNEYTIISEGYGLESITLMQLILYRTKGTIVGPGVIATYNDETETVELSSNSGILWDDWIKHLGVNRDKIKFISVKSGTVHLPNDSRGYSDEYQFFGGLTNLVNINVHKFDTSDVRDMSYMFYDCSSLTDLDLSSFNTSSVRDMSYMFCGCSSLTNLDISIIDTSNVTDMRCMFKDCSSLTNLELTSFDTKNVEDIAYMFEGCSRLAQLDLSSFDISSVAYYSNVFKDCLELQILETPRLNNQPIILSSTMYDTFNNAYVNLPPISESITLVRAKGGIIVGTNTIATFNPDTGTVEFISAKGDLWLDWEKKLGVDLNKVKHIRVAFGTVYLPYNSSNMFSGLQNLESFDLSHIDTANVKDMSSMFSGCSSLKSLDLNSFDTTNVQYMEYMFAGCNSLTSLDLSSFNTSHVSNMLRLFSGCRSLTELNLSNFNTSSVRNMSYMFFNCNSLTNLDLSNFDTLNVTDMSYMFRYCTSLAELNLSSFDTTNVKENLYFVGNCTSLQTLKTPKKNSFVFDLPITMYDESGNTYLKLPLLSRSITLTRQNPTAPDIADCVLTLSVTNYIYDGMPKEPTVIIEDDSYTLISGTDYIVSYANNTNAGTATVKVEGIGNYKGEQSIAFTIEKAAPKLSFASNSVDKTTLDAAFTNELTVTTDGTVTFKSSDIEVATIDSVSGEVVIKGEGFATITATAAEGRNYKSGSANYMLTIVDGRTDISVLAVSLSDISCTYDGKVNEPAVTVKNGSTVLTAGTDYTVSYADNIDAGTATAKVEGIGNYKGEQSIAFTIEKAAPELIFASSSVDKTTLDAAFTNELTVTTDGTVTFKSSDMEVATIDSASGEVMIKGEGSATITAAAAEGKNYKSGSAEYSLTVVDGRKDVSGLVVSLSAISYIYDGKAKEPAVTVKDGSIVLSEGTEYTVSYTDNTDAGTATLKVIGIGSYKGEKSVTFTIDKADAELIFADSALTKKITDPVFTNVLTKTTDGTLSFKSSNTNVAMVNNTSGLVTIKGAGTAAITATAAEGKNYKAGSATYSLTVKALPTPTPTPKPAIAGFSDVQDPNHAYYKAIYWAANAGITKGYSDGTFGINKPCTRGHAVMFLWKMDGAPAPKDAEKTPFPDVPKTHPYYKAVLWAQQKGITKGYTSGPKKGKFGIDDTCTRGQIMTFIWNYKGKPVTNVASKSPFSDVPTTHPYYKAILWGSMNGVTKGYTSGPNAGKFGINDNCTRGQIVKFLYNIR